VEDGVWLGEMHDEYGLHVGRREVVIVTLRLGERARTTGRKGRKVKRERMLIAKERDRTLGDWELIYIVYGMRAETAASD